MVWMPQAVVDKIMILHEIFMIYFLYLKLTHV